MGDNFKNDEDGIKYNPDFYSDDNCACSGLQINPKCPQHKHILEEL